MFAFEFDDNTNTSFSVSKTSTVFDNPATVIGVDENVLLHTPSINFS